MEYFLKSKKKNSYHTNHLLQDIASVYQIFSDEVLGSGQFGIVYGGMCGFWYGTTYI